MPVTLSTVLVEVEPLSVILQFELDAGNGGSIHIRSKPAGQSWTDNPEVVRLSAAGLSRSGLEEFSLFAAGVIGLGTAVPAAVAAEFERRDIGRLATDAELDRVFAQIAPLLCPRGA